jgi:iron complex outermembrane receptor protein
VGTTVENAPRHTSGSWIKYIFSKGFAKGFGIAVGHSQVSSRNTLDPATILPGYLVINAGMQYAWKHFSVAGNLNNLTGRTYWTGAYNNVNKWPGTPRNFMIRLGYGL